MYKALITDLDGTVTAIGTDGSDISEATRAAVSRAQSLGERLACATGRSWESAKPVIANLGLIDPCIIEGGSCIIDPKTEDILWEMSLNEAESAEVLKIFKAQAGDEGSIKSTAITDRTPLKDAQTLGGPNRVIYLMGLDAEAAERVRVAINQTDFAVAHKTTPSWYGPEFTDVHITNPAGTKEHAIAKWQEMMHVTKAETVGLGDSENDLPLFRSAGIRVAVGNAHDNLKLQADKVVASYDQGGLEQAITEVLLS